MQTLVTVVIHVYISVLKENCTQTAHHQKLTLHSALRSIVHFCHPSLNIKVARLDILSIIVHCHSIKLYVFLSFSMWTPCNNESGSWSHNNSHLGSYTSINGQTTGEKGFSVIKTGSILIQHTFDIFHPQIMASSKHQNLFSWMPCVALPLSGSFCHKVAREFVNSDPRTFYFCLSYVLQVRDRLHYVCFITTQYYASHLLKLCFPFRIKINLYWFKMWTFQFFSVILYIKTIYSWRCPYYHSYVFDLTHRTNLLS